MKCQKCQICLKPSKENTEGNPKYCQGHSQAEARKAPKETYAMKMRRLAYNNSI